MKKFMFLIIGLLLLSGCAAQKRLVRIGHSPEFRIDWYTPVKNYKVIQILDPNFFLAVDDAVVRPSVMAVSIPDEEGPVYDGQKIEGLYVMIDTYTYETVSGENKTVPLVVSIHHYEDIKYTEKILTKK